MSVVTPITALPTFKRSVTALSSDKSVIIYAPRPAVGSRILFALRQHSLLQEKRISIFVHLHSIRGGGIDYSRAWAEIKASAFPTMRAQVTDRISFEGALRKAFRQRAGHYVFFVLGPGRGFEDDYWDALALFHAFAIETGIQLGANRLQVAAVDEFSLYFHRRGLERPPSTFYRFEHEIVSALSHDEMGDYFGTLLAERNVSCNLAELTEYAFQITGGHVGLTLHLCDEILSHEGPLDAPFFSLAEQRLAAGAVLDRIRIDIQEDPIGIAKTAVEFRTPNYVIEGLSPRYQFLRQIGALRWESESEAVLCPGLVTRLFDSLANTAGPTRVGTMVEPFGGLHFEEAGIAITDDDLVCVHLSDMHVGPQYAFRLKYEGGWLNPNAAFLSDLIQEDLDRLGLRGKINALIMSGDVASTGEIAEFNRARDVLQQILKACQLTADSLVLVPGNHDVTWDPGQFAAKAEIGATVSRENFATFFELMGLGVLDKFQIKKISSRSGKRAIRLIGLDSNFVESRDAAGIGFVEREALHGVGQQLAQSEADANQDVVNWAVVHHHVLPVTALGLEDAKAKRVSVMANAAELLSYLANWDVELVLHGHEHQPGLTVANRWTSDFRDHSFRPIAVAAAGSCGARRDLLGPIARNHYQILIRQSDSLSVLSRVLGEGGLHFVSYVDFRIPVASWRVSSQGKDATKGKLP